MADLKSLSDQVAAAVNGHSQAGTEESRQELLKSIEQLRIAALGPAEYITRLRYQSLQNMCLVMAIEMGIIQGVAAKEGQPVTAEALARETGSDKLLTARIMRMLTALNICDEVDVQTYKTNANADYLAHPSRLGGMKFISGTTMRNMANVIPYMRANGGVFHQFPDASKGQKSPAEVAYGMPLWELFRKEPEVLADFSAYLSGRRENIVSQWFNIFPAAERLSQQLSEEKEGEGGAASDRPLIVDVGGNIGYDLTNFKKQYPNLSGQLILQDLPENITKAKKLLDGTGIESMEYDFFTPQPVKGARIYYFGCICHDWPDLETKKLLSNTVAAMAPDSLLLIDEMPLPDKNAPLSLVSYDVLMMLNACGIERTIGHYKGLLDEVGLELVKVWTGQLDSVLETRLKR